MECVVDDAFEEIFQCCLNGMEGLIFVSSSLPFIVRHFLVGLHDERSIKAEVFSYVGRVPPLRRGDIVEDATS